MNQEEKEKMLLVAEYAEKEKENLLTRLRNTSMPCGTILLIHQATGFWSRRSI